MVTALRKKSPSSFKGIKITLCSHCSIFKLADSTQSLPVLSLYSHTLAEPSAGAHNEDSAGFLLLLLPLMACMTFCRKAKQVLISVLEELFKPQAFHQWEEMNHFTLKKFSAQASRCWAASSLVTDTGGKWPFSHAADMSRHVNTNLHAHVGEAPMMQTASLGRRAVSHGGPLNSVWTHSSSTAAQGKWLSSVLGLGKIQIYFRYYSLEFHCS